MKVQIFDVSHGFCAYLVADNRNVMLFDCGHNDRTGFRPSNYLPPSGCRAIENFIIHNFDQDHISDLHNLKKVLPIYTLTRNPSIPADFLVKLKLQGGGITDAMQTAIDMHSQYTNDSMLSTLFPEIEFVCFWNPYPLYTDTNNLSLVVFIHYDGMGIVFPGDLEEAGWRSLLKKDDFLSHLKRTNIFVTSHHGRTDGYCEEVFNYCKPEIVIISDKEIVHVTQKQLYQKHAEGSPVNNAKTIRHVLTTRSDGMITISKTTGYNTYIQTEK